MKGGKSSTAAGRSRSKRQFRAHAREIDVLPPRSGSK
jgi:hypothetical protein